MNINDFKAKFPNCITNKLQSVDVAKTESEIGMNSSKLLTDILVAKSCIIGSYDEIGATLRSLIQVLSIVLKLLRHIIASKTLLFTAFENPSISKYATALFINTNLLLLVINC